MHPLNDVFAGVKHTPDVLSVNGRGEMRIAEMAAIMGLHAQFLWGRGGKERERERMRKRGRILSQRKGS